ncbi:MAG: helix-turn-helix transcriptional regulator [Rhodospirillales bacterium]|nr:helix-turn-helix transcriptional regulator [Rhodospirillales bacterium]
MDIRRIIGRNLQRIRLERRLSQEELAFEADIDRTYMSGLERGVRNPTALVLDQLARALHVTICDIVSATPDRGPLPRNLPRGRRTRT